MVAINSTGGTSGYCSNAFLLQMVLQNLPDGTGEAPPLCAWLNQFNQQKKTKINIFLPFLGQKVVPFFRRCEGGSPPSWGRSPVVNLDDVSPGFHFLHELLLLHVVLDPSDKDLIEKLDFFNHFGSGRLKMRSKCGNSETKISFNYRSICYRERKERATSWMKIELL